MLCRQVLQRDDQGHLVSAAGDLRHAVGERGTADSVRPVDRTAARRRRGRIAEPAAALVLLCTQGTVSTLM